MTELGFAFLKEVETGNIKEIKYIDSKYINIEDITLGKIIKKFLKKVYFYLFRKQTLPQEHIYQAIKVNAQEIYDEHNKFLADNNLPVINYYELYSDEEDNQTTNYIN